MDVSVCKDVDFCLYNNCVIGGTTFTIVIRHTTAMFAHGPFTVGIVSANFGIHVTDDQKHVMLWHFGDCLL